MKAIQQQTETTTNLATEHTFEHENYVIVLILRQVVNWNWAGGLMKKKTLC